MKRIIITGGNGFIGSHLVKRLLSSNLSSVVIISYRSDTYDKYFADKKLLQDIPLTFHTAEIRDGKTISDIFKDERADTCVHHAAKISVAHSIQNPDETMDINVKGTLNVLEACREAAWTDWSILKLNLP